MHHVNKAVKPTFKFARQVDNEILLVETTELRFRGHVVKLATHVVARFNITKPVFDSLLSKKYTHFHRMTTGVMVMIVGVAVAKVAGHSPNLLYAGIGDMLGYAIHGVGLTPFAVFLSEKFERS